MPRFTFAGITSGSPAAIVAAQGGATAQGSTASWGQATGNFEIEITARTDLVAPAVVNFGVKNVSGFSVDQNPVFDQYDPAFGEIHWFWSFDDPGTFTLPLVPLNIPDHMRDSNTAFGAMPQHCFHTPGIYQVSATGVCDQGIVGTATFQVTVLSPLDYILGDPTSRRFVCYSPDGDFSEMPQQNAVYHTTWAGAHAELNVRLGADQQGNGWWNCLLIQRDRGGFNYDDIRFTAGNYYGRNLRVMAHGTGGMPVINHDGVNKIMGHPNFGSVWQEAVISGLHLKGLWDAEFEVGTARGATDLRWTFDQRTAAGTVPRSNALIGCYIDGFANFGGWCLFNSKPNARPNADNMIECVITNWQNFAILVDPLGDQSELRKFGMSGSAIMQHADAPTSNIDTINQVVGNAHGMRFNYHYAWTNFDASYFFSRAGWSAGTGGTADQSPLRLHTDGGRRGARFHISRCTTEGGISLLSFESPQLCNAVVEDNLFLMSARSAFAVDLRTPVTFRGNIIDARGKAAVYANSTQYVIVAGSGFGADAEEAAVPLRIYGNTVWIDRSAAEMRAFEPASGAYYELLDPDFDVVLDTVIEENNVFYAPQQSVPETSLEPFDTSGDIAGVTPRYNGTAFSQWIDMGVLSTDVPAGGSIAVPYPAYPGIGQTDQTFWAVTHAGKDHHCVAAKAPNNVNNSAASTEAGTVAVDFQASQIVLTNTGGTIAGWLSETWRAGHKLYVKLDQRATGADRDLTYAAPPTIPMLRPSGNSLAKGKGDGGLRHLRYFDGSIREGWPAALGGPQTGKADKGALKSV